MRLLLFIAAGLFAIKPQSVVAQPIDFNRDIRPILADTCYHCHGPDQARRKADLRLDQEESARKFIVAGNSAKSHLVDRVSSVDPAKQMPPPNSGRKLSKEQIGLLVRWVDQGAKWQKHWAFIAPLRPEPPTFSREVLPSAWSFNPFDRFVLARLQKEGMTPSPRAALTTLIRRVSLDLTGLPPTPREVNEFVRESAASPQAAYEKVVDRLLASPRYGERMAWRWLEAARYADTHGYQSDGPRDMHRWRDWVIDAYNRNLPFDQFTIEQLAGDMLPNATLDQKIATGFNRNHRGNSEGGIVPEEYAVEYVVDRVDTTSTVWLGLTMGCARCHDHKYDPFSQKEFYQLYAYFNSIPEKGRAIKIGNSPPVIGAPTKEQDEKLLLLARKIRDADSAYIARMMDLFASEPRWRNPSANDVAADWIPTRDQIAHLKLDESKIRFVNGKRAIVPGKVGNAADLNGDTFIDAGDVGAFGFDDKFSLSVWVKPRQKNGAILSRMVDEPRADGYGIHLVDGRLQVHMTKRWLDDALRVQANAPIDVNQWSHIAVSYDGSRLASGIKIYLNGGEIQTKVLLDELNQSFNTKEPFRIGSGGGQASRFSGLIDDVRIYGRVLDADEAKLLSISEPLSAILKKPARQRTKEEAWKLNNYVEKGSPYIHEAYERTVLAQEQFDNFVESLPTVMVMQELPQPNDAFVLIRGEYDKRGEKVNRAVPNALPPFPSNAPNNRLGFAHWLTDPKHPLTARVAVNRMWQLHFGIGLVKTVEDFGTQGEYPSHPELLDWLATEFIRTDWDVKKMHKLIVTSATYQQSSRITKDLQAKDPENRLLARGPRYRLSAEMVRDQALLASGLLVEKLGGPSVKPYQPAGLWKELSGSDDYKQDQGENLYRRSLYTFWKRTSAPPSLMTFDASARETCWVRETRTNTPLQALTLLNDVTYVEAARLLAERIINEETSADARIKRAFQLVVSRTPSESERLILGQSLNQHLADYRRNPEAAKKLLCIGDKPADAKIEAGELAAYAQVCSLIFNLDEAVTKE